MRPTPQSPSSINSGFSANPLVLARRLYDWVLAWSKHKHSEWALFTIALMEASFFPIPPDVLLIAMGVGSPKKAIRFALICTLGSVIGGVLGYFIGAGIWSMVSEYFFLYIPGFSAENFDKVTELYRDNGFVAVFGGGFTPLPYKVFTICAGVAGVAFPTFFIASVLSRGTRMLLVGGALYIFGPKIKVYLDKYFGLATILLLILGVGGFLAIKLIL